MKKFTPASTSPGRHRRRPPQSRAQSAANHPDPGTGNTGNTLGPNGDARGWRQPQLGRVTFDDAAGCHVLTLTGEWDLSCRDELSAAASAFACRCRRDDVGVADIDAIVDAAAVAFIDASCLGILVELHRNLHSGGIDVRIRDASAALRRICGLCGLEAVFGLDDSAPATRTSTGSTAPGPLARATHHNSPGSPQLIERTRIDQPALSGDGQRSRWGRPVLLPRAGGWA